MSKDLRFEKEDSSFTDWDESSKFGANGNSTNAKQANAKFRSKQNHIRRVQKRNSSLEHDIGKLH